MTEAAGWALLLSIIPGVAVIGWALLEPWLLEVRRHSLPIRGWPAALDGFRIAVASDWHGRTRFFAGRLADLVNRVEPDLVAVPGDLVDDPGELGDAAAELARIRAPLGVWFVPGNHDHDLGPGGPPVEAVCAAVRRAGGEVLRNEGRRLEVRGAGLWLAGVDDPSRKRDNVAAALLGAREDEPVILLAHAPRAAVRPEARRAALVIAGHTHGGQVCVPFFGPVVTKAGKGVRFVRGLYRDDGRWVYVSCGLGTVTLPLRFGCRPEVAVLELRAEAAPGESQPEQGNARPGTNLTARGRMPRRGGDARGA